MPELRKDPIVGRWVIIATDRAKRPVAPKNEPLPPAAASAPSARATRTTRRTRSSPTATAAPGPTSRAGASASCPTSSPPCRSRATCNKRGDGIYDKMNGIGAHEVIIECPFHEVSMANLTEENIREVLWVYRDRLVDLKKDPRLVYGMVFKNVGAAAGASLEHIALAADRHADRADQRLGGDDRVAGVLQLSRPLHLLRHDPSGAGSREAHRARHAELRQLLPRSPAASRSRRGSCPRTTTATTRTSRRTRWTSWARC